MTCGVQAATSLRIAAQRAERRARWSPELGCVSVLGSHEVEERRAQVLQHVWIAARHSLRMVFEQVTIQQLADGKLPQAVAALTEDDDAWQPH